MSVVRTLITIAACWLTVVGAWGADKAEKGIPEKDRAAIIQKLKAKTDAARLEGVQTLGGIHDPEAARLLYQYGLRDPVEMIRRTAYDALLKLKDDRPVCDFLVDQINHESRKTTPDSFTPLLMSVLLSSDAADVQTASMRYINEKLAPTKGGPLFLAIMADMLAQRADAGDVIPLQRVAESKLFDQLVVSRAVVRALTLIDDASAVDALVQLVPKLSGEAQADAMEYLALATNQKQLVQPQQWTEWWAANKATFQFPKPFTRPATRKVENIVGGETALYYGLPLYGKRLVFILDNSGSMQGGRLPAAKRELINAVQGLKDEVKFGIVVFSGTVSYWKRELVPADTAHKIDATKFVERIELGTQTATYDALQASFYFDAEAVYLLTDGAPTAGKVVAPMDIINAITRQNYTRRESIYTIGIAPGEPESIMEQFLRTLAERNFGLYRRVDE